MLEYIHSTQNAYIQKKKKKKLKDKIAYMEKDIYLKKANLEVYVNGKSNFFS
jgi:hypothetical protein